MNKLLLVLIFCLTGLPCVACAGTRALDRIVTAEMKASDFKEQKENCTTNNNRTICASILYRYEIDEQGRLYFAALTTYNTVDPGSSPPPSSPASTFICQLDSTLNCVLPEVSDQTLDLSAYAVSEQGVLVHGKINPWGDVQKAALFLPRIVQNIQSAVKTQLKMMNNLTCYIFDFDALVHEFKTYGHLIDDDSKRLLRPDACMSSFQEICGDSSSRRDQLNLAATNIADHESPKTLTINARDIDRFCNSIKTTKSAMLR